MALAAGVFGWIGMDFYFNFYRQAQKETDVEIVEVQESESIKQVRPARENIAPEPENGFSLAVYRDDRYGIEFQYPTIADDARCPAPQKNDDGFSLGQCYFFAGRAGEAMEDFMARQLQGMEIENQEIIAVGGNQIPAIKADYQTSGMGWFGSSVFIDCERGVFEFGILANEIAENCGGARDYDDRVYQSAIATLKLAD